MSEPKSSTNRLTRAEARRLEDYIQTRRAELEAGRVAIVELVPGAAELLARRVTRANILGACRAVGIEFRPPTPPKPDDSLPADLQAATEAIQRHAAAIKALNQAIDDHGLRTAYRLDRIVELLETPPRVIDYAETRGAETRAAVSPEALAAE